MFDYKKTRLETALVLTIILCITNLIFDFLGPYIRLMFDYTKTRLETALSRTYIILPMFSSIKSKGCTYKNSCEKNDLLQTDHYILIGEILECNKYL